MRNTQRESESQVFPLFYERESRNGNLSHEYEVKRDGFKKSFVSLFRGGGKRCVVNKILP